MVPLGSYGDTGNAARQRRFKERLRLQGRIKIEVWVTAEEHEQLKKRAAVSKHNETLAKHCARILGESV